MLLAALLLAQSYLPPVPQRMAPDEEITALACTFESALRGERCVYEAQSAPADPRDNAGAVLDAALPRCAAEAHGDAHLRKDCERAVDEASHSPPCARTVRLADATGHLTPEAASCVGAVAEVLRRAHAAATLSHECCACLAASPCHVAPAQCRREVADLTPGTALRACLANSTCAACGFVMTPPAEDEPKARSTPRTPPADDDSDKT